MHSAPRGAFAGGPAAGPAAAAEGQMSPTSAAAARKRQAQQPSYVTWRQLSAAAKRDAWLEANPYLLGDAPDPR